MFAGEWGSRGIMGGIRLTALLALLAASGALASEPALSAFTNLPADPAPPELVRGMHYWMSNEDHLDLFHPAVKDKGGLYIGVGTDQNYLLGAWARPEGLVLMDFDQSIVDLHRVYRVIFLAAETPEELLRLWRLESRPEMDGRGAAAARSSARRPMPTWAARSRWAPGPPTRTGCMTWRATPGSG